MNFKIVLFKNKVRKKIIKTFITFNKAQEFFKKYKKDNESIVFHKEFANGEESQYEIGLIHIGKGSEGNVYLKDEYGRNIKVALENKEMSIIEICPVKIEEFLYDYQTKKKISLNRILKTYLKGKGIKLISGLNNKVIVQEEDNFNILITKSEKECDRFLETLSNLFFKEKRIDCIVVKDNSIAQRKYLYSLLESKGYDKQFLYRKSTFNSL
jgi:predicted transcriptional regulator with HTH domain